MAKLQEPPRGRLQSVTLDLGQLKCSRGNVVIDFFLSLIFSMTVAGKKAVVTSDYKALEQDELSLKRGDIVHILGKAKFEGWWKGVLGSKIGVLPSTFVELIDERETVETQDKYLGLL